MRGRRAWLALVFSLISAVWLPAPEAAPAAVPAVTDFQVRTWFDQNARYGIRASWSDPGRVDGIAVCVSDTPPPYDGQCDRNRDGADGEYGPDATRSDTFRFPPRLTCWVSVVTWRWDGTARQYSERVTAKRRGVRFADTMRGSIATITYGDSARIWATLVDGESGRPLAHRRVKLWVANPDPSRYQGSKLVGETTTGSRGRAHYRVSPRHTRNYMWTFDGDSRHGGASGGGAVNVAYRLTATLTKPTVAPGEHTKIYGIVRPRRDGRRVHLLRDYPGGSVAYRTLSQSVPAKVQRLPDGRVTFGYVMRVARDTPGRYHFETGIISPDRHNAGGTSDPIVLRVRG